MEISGLVNFLICYPWSTIFTKSSELVYINVVEDWFKGPRLMSAKGRIIWTGMFHVMSTCRLNHLLSWEQGWYSHTGHLVSFPPS